MAFERRRLASKVFLLSEDQADPESMLADSPGMPLRYYDPVSLGLCFLYSVSSPTSIVRDPSNRSLGAANQPRLRA